MPAYTFMVLVRTTYLYLKLFIIRTYLSAARSEAQIFGVFWQKNMNTSQLNFHDL